MRPYNHGLRKVPRITNSRRFDIVDWRVVVRAIIRSESEDKGSPDRPTARPANRPSGPDILSVARTNQLRAGSKLLDSGA